jgi:hypothetical protein
MANEASTVRRRGAAGLQSGVTVFGLLGALALASCSGKAAVGFQTDGGSDDGGTTANGNGGGGGGGAAGDGATTAPVKLGNSGDSGGGDNSGDCPASAKLVYITGVGSKLYSFYPPTFTFTPIGTLDCLGSEYTPTHMTVDRTGTAWVVAWNENNVSSLFTASTADASCQKVASWTPDPTGPFWDFALTFVGTSNTPDTTLYILGSTGGPDATNGKAVLGSFDTSTGAVTTIGMPDVANAGGDMTTNGDGTLYYLQDTKRLELYQLLPSNGAIGKTYAPSATGGGDQALAFWGGSFYPFEANIAYQYDPSTKETTMLGPAPFQVTGAGQSTCVPMTAPPDTK